MPKLNPHESNSQASKPQEVNPFQIFGIPCTFNINTIALITQFANLQKKHHPDSSNSSQSQSSQSQSSQNYLNAANALNITQAFETLKNEITRGQAILAIHNIALSSVAIPQEFLVMLIECESPSQMQEVQKLYNAQKEILQNFGTVNENNVAIFAIEFLKYKYLKSKLF